VNGQTVERSAGRAESRKSGWFLAPLVAPSEPASAELLAF
jgi:hypothetical protein